MKHDCKKGCSFCCLIRAHVGGAEKDIVLKALREMPNQDVAIKRAEHRQNMGFTSGGGLHPCVALGPDGACQIYESRPETCRTYYSTDVRECEKGSQGKPWDKSTVIITERTVSEQLAYIDELYLAQVRGESTEIHEMDILHDQGSQPLYVDEGNIAVIHPAIKKIVDKMPKVLGAAVIVDKNVDKVISVTKYSKQIQIE